MKSFGFYTIKFANSYLGTKVIIKKLTMETELINDNE